MKQIINAIKKTAGVGPVLFTHDELFTLEVIKNVN